MRDDVRRLLDGELDEDAARALLEALPAAERREVEALARIAAAAAGLERPSPSEGFAARAMARVRVRRPPRRSLWTWLRSPRLTPLAALGGAAAAALLAVGATAGLGRSAAPPPPPAEVVLARLDLHAPEARRVEVAGDFNGWRPEATPLRRGEGGVWSARIPLSPGKRYEYMFLVDGAWVGDPAAPATADDGFGGANAVLEL
jgi:Carbohydrate-binding module 48 (Isoamylase N-terminal domain)